MAGDCFTILTDIDAAGQPVIRVVVQARGGRDVEVLEAGTDAESLLALAGNCTRTAKLSLMTKEQKS